MIAYVSPRWAYPSLDFCSASPSVEPYREMMRQQPYSERCAVDDMQRAHHLLPLFLDTDPRYRDPMFAQPEKLSLIHI